MPDYLDTQKDRSIFAEKMIEKRNFKDITHQIKKECLNFGYGTIHFDKDKEGLWINEYENTLSASIHVDAIKINYDEISLYENNQCVLTFDHVCSVDRQIQIYETIYDCQNQLHYYELDWDHYFKALRVTDGSNHFFWRVLTPDEARHVWFNGKGELFQVYDDGTEGAIDDEARLYDCIQNGFTIGISL